MSVTIWHQYLPYLLLRGVRHGSPYHRAWEVRAFGAAMPRQASGGCATAGRCTGPDPGAVHASLVRRCLGDSCVAGRTGYWLQGIHAPTPFGWWYFPTVLLLELRDYGRGVGVVGETLTEGDGVIATGVG